MDNRSKAKDTAPTHGIESPSPQQGRDQAKTETEADHLHTILKPLHNLPRGKNTWDPKFINIWWFWPASAALLVIIFYVYPYIWDFFFGP